MKTDLLIDWMNAGCSGKFILGFYGVPSFITPRLGYIRGFKVYVVMN